jgi:hypothetical protein
MKFRRYSEDHRRSSLKGVFLGFSSVPIVMVRSDFRFDATVIGYCEGATYVCILVSASSPPLLAAGEAEAASWSRDGLEMMILWFS